MKTFSLVYTTVRSDYVPKVVQLWNSRADRPEDIEWVISVDGNDPKTKLAADQVPGAKVVVQTEPPYCSTRGWNAAAEVSTGKVLIFVADDFLPPLKWDKGLRELSPATWMDEDWMVFVGSGYVEEIAVLTILTRVRYNKFGYGFYPAYPSMFSDTECTCVAARDGALLFAKHLLFEHLHPSCGKRISDVADIAHASNARWKQGEAIFNLRKADGFPLDNGPLARWEEPPANPNYAVHMQVIVDDFCLFEVCQRLFEEGVHDFFFTLPDTYWDGRATTETEKQVLQATLNNVEALGARVDRSSYRVADYRQASDHKHVTVETRIRNAALNRIRRRGFRHILVVDSDELWPRGLLAKVQKKVVECRPSALSCPMVPAVGLPGYPVEGASDRAIIYLDAYAFFAECRTPFAAPLALPRDCALFHFSGVRRTMEEVVAKHVHSGHYDDRDYDFQGWLRDVLPRIKPGMRRGHMYRGADIWPAIRHWRPEELAEIPASLHTYLGELPTELKNKI